MRIGVFGGTFNPVHYGHLRAAEEVRERLSLGKVLFVPAGNPPLKYSGLAPAGDRLRMAELAVSANEYFEVSDLECRSGEVSYTVDTALQLRGLYPDASLYFILGIDAFLDIPRWHEPERLVGLVDFAIINRPPHEFTEIITSPYVATNELAEPLDGGFFTVPLRGGRTAVLVDVTPIAISATSVRAAAREGRSIKYLLPENVESFIITHGLYAGN